LKTKVLISLFTLVLLTTAANSQWTEYDLPGTYGNSNDIVSVTNQIIFSAGHDIHKSTNGGINWVKQTNLAYENQRTEIQFYNSSTGWSCGADGSFMKTTNGGTNWVETFAGFETLTGLDFINSNTGYLSTETGKVLKTTNGGSNWTSYSPSQISYLTSVFFLNDQTGWASGSQGTTGKVIRTTNGGLNWVIQLNNVFNAVDHVYFRNAETGFAGCYKKMYRTTNGGNSWDTVNIHSDVNDIKCVLMVSVTTGYATGSFFGNSGGVIKTFDGGLNWYLQWAGSPNSANSISFAPGSTANGWVSTNSGVLRTTNSGGELIGIQPVSNIILEKYELSQNYPNPFNPTTNIKLQIPESGLVKLVVFDVTGRQVAELVNETLMAGEYKVDFNASGLTSGVYFYRITTAGFSDAKKMILVK